MSTTPVATITSVAPSPVAPINIGDIANYAYIWFNNESKTITEKEKDFIHETITKGTFPTYFKIYTRDEKEALFANEIEFVRQKFSENDLSHITILQIPRILYDLFNLLSFYHTHPGIKAKYDEEIILYECKPNIITLDLYKVYTNEIIEKFKNKIFELNDGIIHFLNAHNFLDPINIVNNYKNILELIMSDIHKIPLELRKHNSPAINTIERIAIFHEILNFERLPASNSILLYRGAYIIQDSTIENKSDGTQSPCSLSMNLSILNGFIGDDNACTINYMTDPKLRRLEKIGNDKIKYTIKKFMFDDGSLENSLFFIPQIPPYLQFYCSGELWHPRTKIGNNIPAGRTILRGLFCLIDFTKEFTYLKSDKSMQELEYMYQSYKTDGNITIWRKYIKYKTKYLELKNQLDK